MPGGIGEEDDGDGGIGDKNVSVQGDVNPAWLNSFFCSQENSSEKSFSRVLENVSSADSDINPMENRAIIAVKWLMKISPFKKIVDIYRYLKARLKH